MTALEDFRLLIADTDTANQVLTDDQAIRFLGMYGVAEPEYNIDADIWLVRRAAAEALDAIAISETLIGKVIRSQDLSTDGTKVAASLRAQADRFRARADDEEYASTGGDPGLSVIEFSPWSEWQV